jgi:hypothetical protein
MYVWENQDTQKKRKRKRCRQKGSRQAEKIKTGQAA